ncbi:hypothetical protein [Streptomyces sp. NPDC057689]|uniref:hypothetical protein n=1 Tax=Streptomyces sp. NPDC057689 TaxID=3346213 RepID=UPI0036A1AA1E
MMELSRLWVKSWPRRVSSRCRRASARDVAPGGFRADGEDDGSEHHVQRRLRPEREIHTEQRGLLVALDFLERLPQHRQPAGRRRVNALGQEAALDAIRVRVPDLGSPELHRRSRPADTTRAM